MKSVTIHAGLLVAALVLAFFTWTSGNTPEADTNLVEIWDRDPARLVSVTFRSAVRTLQLERRSGADTTYLWGIETTRQQPRVAGPDSTARDSSAAPAAPSAPQVDQYPIGEQGTALVETLARLRAVRDLGKANADERAAYGVTPASDTLTLEFRGGERRILALGGSVVGGGDRYVLDTKAGRVYVLPANLVQPFEVPTALRLMKLQNFEFDDVRGVVLRAGGTERVMKRAPTAEPPYVVWTAPGSDQPDQAFANFMGQFDALWVAKYRPDVKTDTLQNIVRIAFLSASSDTLGRLELFRTRAGTPATYFVRTTATVVPGEAYAPVAERIEQDVRTLFGGPRQAQR